MKTRPKGGYFLFTFSVRFINQLQHKIISNISFFVNYLCGIMPLNLVFKVLFIKLNLFLNIYFILGIYLIFIVVSLSAL